MKSLQSYGQELHFNELLHRAHRSIADCIVSAYSTNSDPLDRDAVVDALHRSIDRVVDCLRSDEQDGENFDRQG